MSRKVYKCLVCNAPTVAANKLCKKESCYKQRMKDRMHIVPNAHSSGVFISLKHCPHGKPLNDTHVCKECEKEWNEAQNDKDVMNCDSNPRIKL